MPTNSFPASCLAIAISLIIGGGFFQIYLLPTQGSTANASITDEHKIRREIESLQEELSRKKTEHSVLTADIETREAQLSKSQDSTPAEIKLLTEQLEIAEEKYRELEARISAEESKQFRKRAYYVKLAGLDVTASDQQILDRAIAIITSRNVAGDQRELERNIRRCLTQTADPFTRSPDAQRELADVRTLVATLSAKLASAEQLLEREHEQRRNLEQCIQLLKVKQTALRREIADTKYAFELKLREQTDKTIETQRNSKNTTSWQLANESPSSLPSNRVSASSVPASFYMPSREPASGTSALIHNRTNYTNPNYRPPVDDHWVAPYTRRDGTRVRGHYRTNPDDSFWNNYSARGNRNPHTGKKGTAVP